MTGRPRERTGPDVVQGQARIEVDRAADDQGMVITRAASIEARNRVTPEQAGQDSDDPEPERDLLLVPAAQLEVVVERRHPEDALAAR